MKIIEELIEGIFLAECKNRFLCKVLINGIEVECYLPSSSKLEPLINLKGKKVLLTLNKATNIRTKYSVFAVKHYNKYILLNLNVANLVLGEHLQKSYGFLRSSSVILREKTIEGYKADFALLGEHKTLFEAKSIISTKQATLFPSVNSNRAIEQLYKIGKLLDLGWNVQYYFISLSPFVKILNINSQFQSYIEQFNNCLHKGMEVKGLGCSFLNNEVIITHELKFISPK
ncbi:MAG: nuclease SfsA [Eubacterium sp.]|jgi:DNA-binding sugar fermentation-stimulating protein|nr:nuclease SfsA [Eubacterium sp.]